jgi:hypothetical protein
MEDKYFLDLARRLIGKQVRIGFITGRNCSLTDGHMTATILGAGEDFFTVRCSSLSSTEDVAINPGAVSMMLFPKQFSEAG